MKKVLIALFLGAVAQGVTAEEQLIKGHIDYTYATRYMTHGFNVGDTPAHQPSVGLSSDKLPGFSFLLWSSMTVDRDKQGNDEWDLMFFYNRLLMQNDPWAIAFSSYYDYWFYPNSTGKGGKAFQGHKIHLGGGLPNLIPMPEGFSLVPAYNFYYWTPVSDDQFTSGGLHELVLNLGIPLPLPEAPAVPQSINLKGTMSYHTGFQDVKGLTHATAHLTVGAPIWKMISWHGSLDYQESFEEDPKIEDQFWGTLGVNAGF
ncbi:hypothetical protein P4B35_17185 [Pontiellaceae bacterium B12227]|nr:hypothetical protein [Pontiellaceae bacterium B12227]